MRFNGPPAIVADHELCALVLMSGFAGNIGIEAFDSMNEPPLGPKLYGAIDRWWLRIFDFLAQAFENFIRSKRFFACSDDEENSKAWLCGAVLVRFAEF